MNVPENGPVCTHTPGTTQLQVWVSVQMSVLGAPVTSAVNGAVAPREIAGRIVDVSFSVTVDGVIAARAGLVNVPETL